MSKPDSHLFECIVVGAGISGLIAAGKLGSAGVRVKVLDKARGVGGRMATRRMDDYRFDHGAQRIPGGSGEYANLLSRWQDQKLVARCKSEAFIAFHDYTDHDQCYCCPGGMTSVAKHLAQDLEVETNCRVTQVECVDNVWQLVTDTERIFYARAIVLTPPVPQALQIIEKEKRLLEHPEVKELSSISYEKCFALMAVFDDPLEGLSDYSFPKESPVAAVIDNYAKGVSGRPGALTIHATPEFSESHFDDDIDDVTDLLLKAILPLTAQNPVTRSLHRWRYSQVERGSTETHLLLREPAPIGFAGDAFGPGGIDGAAQSGLSVAGELLKILAP